VIAGPLFGVTIANVTLTPEQIAGAFWNLPADEMLRFFAELDRVAGVMLCFQMAGVIAEFAKMESDDHVRAMNGFRTMLAHAANYAEGVAEFRASSAKSEITAMNRYANRRLS
jgi:hypothetical protein